MSRRILGRFLVLSLFSVLLFAAGLLAQAHKSYAHFSHSPHYNGGGVGVGPYYFYEALNPEFASPGSPTGIEFSVQDTAGNDVHNIKTMVEIYDGATGERLHAFPWTLNDVGDFELFYTFPHEGNYQIVLSTAAPDSPNTGTDPPRNILSSNLNCNCERGVFNVSVTKSFGSIFYSTFFSGAFGIIAAIGVIAFQVYRARNRMARSNRNIGFIDRRQLLQYAVMFSAIAAGVVHLTVYADHSTLNVDYSIFLLVAAVAQAAYGISYAIFTLSTDANYVKDSIESTKDRHRKFMTVNLFGLFGTGVLIGLYIYVVIFPPPLSPINQPEDVDLSGVLDKSIEGFTFVGIVFLIIWERREMRTRLVRSDSKL